MAQFAQPEASTAVPLPSQEEASAVAAPSQEESPSQKDPSHGVSLSPQESPVAPLSQWLQLMLGEIARKREELEHAHAEAARRAAGE